MKEQLGMPIWSFFHNRCQAVNCSNTRSNRQETLTVGSRTERFSEYCSKDKPKTHCRVIVGRARKVIFGGQNERGGSGGSSHWPSRIYRCLLCSEVFPDHLKCLHPLTWMKLIPTNAMQIDILC